MRVTILHKTISNLLSLSVLLASTSVTIEKHFCGGELVDVAVFSNVKSCCESKSVTKQVENDNDGCCKNEVEVLEGIDDLVFETVNDLEIDLKLFASALTLFQLESLEENQNAIPHRHYRPPLLFYDIHVLNESYLI